MLRKLILERSARVHGRAYADASESSVFRGRVLDFMICEEKKRFSRPVIGQARGRRDGSHFRLAYCLEWMISQPTNCSRRRQAYQTHSSLRECALYVQYVLQSTHLACLQVDPVTPLRALSYISWLCGTLSMLGGQRQCRRDIAMPLEALNVAGNSRRQVQKRCSETAGRHDEPQLDRRTTELAWGRHERGNSGSMLHPAT